MTQPPVFTASPGRQEPVAASTPLRSAGAIDGGPASCVSGTGAHDDFKHGIEDLRERRPFKDRILLRINRFLWC